MLSTIRTKYPLIRAHYPALSLASLHTLPPQDTMPIRQRPPFWKSLAPAPLALSAGSTPSPTAAQGPGTFSAQSSLPHLPIPPLQDTLKRLRDSLKPLAHSKEEFDEVTRKINEFGKEGGKGRELHARLEKWRDDGEKEGRDHWLEEWWDDGAYLGYRDSVSSQQYPPLSDCALMTSHIFRS